MQTLRDRLLASSMICGAALAVASPSFAADADNNEVAEIVVTGTRIPTPNLTSVSPVTAIGSADIKAQGVTRVEDMINSMPQAFAAQGGQISNGSNGTATVNLRGLGASRTLVLIDGRRVGPGNPASGGAGAVANLNFIPSPLVERVDILTGGASAVYGADAVSGVVNFIMKKDFEGVRIDAQWQTYQHSQHSDGIQAILRAKAAGANDPSQFAVPQSNVRDGDGSEVTLTMGVNSPDGKGNITTYASYRQINAVLERDRDYSACTLNSGAVFTCGGSGTASPARVGGFTVSGNTFRARNAANDVYNFGPTNFFQRPDERYTLGAFAHYNVSDWAQVYSQVMFMDDNSTAQIAPGGIFAAGFNINCDNAFLTAAQGAQLCGASAGTPTNVNVIVGKRNVEGGGRQSSFRNASYRYVVGMKGDLGDNWNYDGYLDYTSTTVNASQTAFFQTARIQNSLIVRRNAAGNIVCQSVIDGSDPACVPYNIFQEGQVTQAALNYLQVPSYSGGNATERVANLTFGGDLTSYGVKLPWANDGVGVAFGAEYRREHVDFHSDFVSRAGLLNGAGGAAPPIDKSFDVYEAFGEARIPIAQDQPWAKSLQLELAYRYSDYSFGVTTNTYKIGGDWTPMDGYRLRASYQRAVRAPNIVELFGPQNVVLDGNTDPCAGLTAGNPLVATCARIFKLTTAQVLAIEKNPAPQYNGLVGGNPNLQPELADTYSVGLVAQPSFLPGFNATIDWFDIKVDKFISGIGADNIINQCLTTESPFYCNLIQRDARNSLYLSPQGFVRDTTFNTGSLHTAGVDLSANYRTSLDAIGLEDMGGISFAYSGTWLDKLETQSLPGGPTIDCAGLYGLICTGLGGSTGPNPHWRHRLRATWTTPFPLDLALSAQVRYFGGVDLDTTSSQAGLGGSAPGGPKSDLKLGSRTWLDLLATFTIKDNYNFRIGVNNVLDKDPPLNGSSSCPSGACNGNTWPQNYDSLGRFFFVGLTADF